ncbi:hypothetical protein J2Y69_002154 [Microbacterium resistens]|uniref:DUF3040 domain-containing protein n=1 Tax=Microbacterium resistens TaxID=156977 RepID=A0ABU1SD64_9MICO|nr:hypothetical protein [Microbacterium resistens]MDR6867550.1 hypothetical protein [Microbacterium resistens]
MMAEENRETSSMAAEQDGREGADEGTEASDHDYREQRDLERRAPRDMDGRLGGPEPSSRDEQAGRVHRLHGISDRDGGRDDGDGSGAVPLPAQTGFSQVTHEFTVRKSPWLPPEELRAYHEIDPEFARGIIHTVTAAQQARIDAELIPIRAEAWSLKVATLGVTFLPWLAAILAVFFVVNGLDTAALISGLFSAATGGVQIIQAVRRPRVVEVPIPISEPTQALDKTQPKRKGNGKKKPKKRR